MKYIVHYKKGDVRGFFHIEEGSFEDIRIRTLEELRKRNAEFLKYDFISY